MLRTLLLLATLLPGLAHAAASVQPLTPANTSVLGGERQVYSARFFDALGNPAVGETVTFANDACGFFDNGAFSIAVVTDAGGVAAAAFTARAQGITCWVTAQAGVTARFNVYTYTLGQVALSGSMFPAEPRPGEPFAFSASANAGAYPIYEARLSASVVAAGAATLVGSGETAQVGRADFTVTPHSASEAFDIELAYRGLTKRFAIAGSSSPWQDMWWAGPGENGWGMSIVQHGDRIFAAMYVYDASGAPTWYVMPGGEWNASRTTIVGEVYSPRGAPYTAYEAARFRAGDPAGTVMIAFDADGATLTYEIGGLRGAKALTRQRFGPPEAIAAPVSAGDMWWGGASENGWGIALLQQHRTIFGVWFTYGADGRPTWFVMPAGFWENASTWSGRIYRTRGSAWLGTDYDAGMLASTDVGAFSIRFEGEGRATLGFTMDGKPGTIALMRQAF